MVALFKIMFDASLELRKVKPYMFTFQTYAKQRWLNKSIFQVFEKEFHDRPAESYVSDFHYCL